MVNQIVPREELEAFTLKMAEKIATKPSMGLKLAKQSVNQAVDAQGFWPASRRPCRSSSSPTPTTSSASASAWIPRGSREQ